MSGCVRWRPDVCGWLRRMCGEVLLPSAGSAFRLERLTGGEPRSTSEASRVAWLTPEEAIAAAPEARAVRIADTFREDGPFVRVHDVVASVLSGTDFWEIWLPGSAPKERCGCHRVVCHQGPGE